MLRLDDVHVRYGSKPAVRGVSLEIGSGEAVAVLGPNGAGKSSLLKAVTGLVPPASGDVWFLGNRIGRLRPESIARLGIALIPEGRRIFANMTVEENLRLGLSTRRETRGAVALAEIYDRFAALEALKARPAGKLSGGEQQQLAIARALLAAPQLLLLDEPSLGLAPMVVDSVFDLLLELRHKDGLTILLVEQNVARAIDVVDRAYFMENGVVQRVAEADALRQVDALAELYSGFHAERSGAAL